MDIQRARDIAASPVMADVTVDGVPVYIQHVDEANETARIYPLDRPEQERNVPIRSLSEADDHMAMEVDRMVCRVTGDPSTE